MYEYEACFHTSTFHWSSTVFEVNSRSASNILKEGLLKKVVSATGLAEES
jgi:hypothetical protein